MWKKYFKVARPAARHGVVVVLLLWWKGCKLVWVSASSCFPRHVVWKDRVWLLRFPVIQVSFDGRLLPEKKLWRVGLIGQWLTPRVVSVPHSVSLLLQEAPSLGGPESSCSCTLPPLGAILQDRSLLGPSKYGHSLDLHLILTINRCFY